jgi:Rieske Fe-S protein
VSDQRTDPQLDRRSVVRAAGVLSAGAAGIGALAACGTSSASSAAPAPAAPSTSSAASSVATSGSSSGASSSSSGSSGAAAPSGAPVKTADIPVGGGIINGDALFVVTQPSAGQFKAFSATCTHQGCTVTRVENGAIKCPCHGSQFDVSTGSPQNGPATKPLPAKTATVSGDSVYVA